jgi:hypothetical protein
VKEYQRDNGLIVDGLVGQQTWTSLQERCDSGDGEAAPAPQQEAAPAPQQESLVVVPNVVGYRNKDAESALRSLGLRVYARYTNTDSSLAAQATNACVVVGQQPGGGSQVAEGTTITIAVDCPTTGY